jgi:hypothetical protein
MVTNPATSSNSSMPRPYPRSDAVTRSSEPQKV